jgi:hypothetical protein
MQNAELTEVTGKSLETRPKFGDSIKIRPLSTLLPRVSPIHDLLITTNRLQHAGRFYGVANVAAVTTLLASLIYAFSVYVSVF